MHLADWPEVENSLIDHDLEARWDRLIKLKEEVLKALEEKRIAKLIGSPLEAKVEITSGSKEELEFLSRYLPDLRYIFIVSHVGLEKGDKREIRVAKADGKKCSRCWNWSAKVGSDNKHPTLCERCSSVVTEEISK